MRVIIRKRTGRILSLILSLSMVMSMCTTAFGAQAVSRNVSDSGIISVDHPDLFISAEDAPGSLIQSAAHGDRTWVLPVPEPDEWNINKSPAQWNTARFMAAGANAKGTVARPTQNAAGEVNSIVYLSPFSYFFSPYSPGGVKDIVDGRVVVGDPVERQKNIEDYFYRAIDAGNGYFVLVRYNVKDTSFISYYPDDYDVNAGVGYFNFEYRYYKYDAEKDTYSQVAAQHCSNYYDVNGDLQPIVQYSSRKKVWVDMAKGKAPKPNEDQCIYVDAVLVKHDGQKTEFVCGLPIKSVKAKNNVFATLSSTNLVLRNDRNNDTTNQFGWTRPDPKDDKDDIYTGFKSQPLITDNAFLKSGDSQPSFTIQVGADKDVDKTVKPVIGAANKALKNENFNFQIARLNIGDTRFDKLPANETCGGLFGTVFYRGTKYLTGDEWDANREEVGKSGKTTAIYDAAVADILSIINSKEVLFGSTYTSFYKALGSEGDVVRSRSPGKEATRCSFIRMVVDGEERYYPIGCITLNRSTELPMYLNAELDYDIIYSEEVIKSALKNNNNQCTLRNRNFANAFDISNEKGRTQLSEKSGNLKLKLCYRRANVNFNGKKVAKLVAQLLKASIGLFAIVQEADTDSLEGYEGYANLSAEYGNLISPTNPSSHYNGASVSDFNRMMLQLRSVLYYGMNGSDSDHIIAHLIGGLTPGGNAASALDDLAVIIDYLENDEGAALTSAVAQEVINVLVASGVPVSLINKIIKCNVSYSKTKISNKDGGKIDIFVQPVTAEYPAGYGNVGSVGEMGTKAQLTAKGAGKDAAGSNTASGYPVLILHGRNNMEGDATMRLDENGKTIRLGNWKDETHWWVDDEE